MTTLPIGLQKSPRQPLRLDGDGDLDAFAANNLGQPNRVWLNDGSSNFTDSGQLLGNTDSFVVLGRTAVFPSYTFPYNSCGSTPAILTP